MLAEGVHSIISHPPCSCIQTPEAPVGSQACCAHPTSPITLLRYLVFIVTHSRFLLCTLCQGVQSIISQTPCRCIQICRSPGRIHSMLCTSYKPNNTSQIPWFHIN